MNTDQVIEGISKAVSAVQPAQEYCILGFWGVTWWPVCMTKAEWSGWMQAFGAVLALGIAIWVAGSHERLEKRDALIKARVFAKQLVLCVQGMAYRNDRKTHDVFLLSIASLEELKSFSLSVRSERMPESAMLAFIDMRQIAVAILLNANAVREDPSAENDAKFEKRIRFYSGLILEHVRVLFSAHGGVAAENFDPVAFVDEFIAAATAVQKADQTQAKASPPSA